MTPPGRFPTVKTPCRRMAREAPASTVPEPNAVAALLVTGAGALLARRKSDRDRKAD